jgi:hypothetical protein
MASNDFTTVVQGPGGEVVEVSLSDITYAAIVEGKSVDDLIAILQVQQQELQAHADAKHAELSWEQRLGGQ